jgi:hypothetical protein
MQVQKQNFLITISEQNPKPTQEKTWFEKGKEFVCNHPVLTASAVAGAVAAYFYGPAVISYFGSLFSTNPVPPSGGIPRKPSPLKPNPIPPIKTPPKARTTPIPPPIQEPVVTVPLSPKVSVNSPKPTPNAFIKVFTSYTTDNPERLSMSHKVVANQKAYCKDNGYLYEVYEKNLAPDSLPYWSKIAGINRLLASKRPAEWIVWLDDDAVIVNQKIKLAKVIQDLSAQHPEANVFVTKDVPHADTQLNTGVLIVRNSDISRNIFQKIWEMRNQVVPRFAAQRYTYGKCPSQLCLHEQEAMHNLLIDHPVYQKNVKIIPQRDSAGLGINTFRRFNHYDDNRGGMPLSYGGDPSTSTYRQGDFITQCTGLSTKGRREVNSPQENLREACIDELIKNSIRA